MSYVKEENVFVIHHAHLNRTVVDDTPRMSAKHLKELSGGEDEEED